MYIFSSEADSRIWTSIWTSGHVFKIYSSRGMQTSNSTHCAPRTDLCKNVHELPQALTGCQILPKKHAICLQCHDIVHQKSMKLYRVGRRRSTNRAGVRRRLSVRAVTSNTASDTGRGRACASTAPNCGCQEAHLTALASGGRVGGGGGGSNPLLAWTTA